MLFTLGLMFLALLQAPSAQANFGSPKNNATMWRLCKNALTRLKTHTHADIDRLHLTQAPLSPHLQLAKEMGFANVDERALAVRVFEAYLEELRVQVGSDTKILGMILSSGLASYDFDNPEYANANIGRWRARFGEIERQTSEELWADIKTSLFLGIDMKFYEHNALSPVERWSLQSMFKQVARAYVGFSVLEEAWAQFLSENAGEASFIQIAGTVLVFLPDESQETLNIKGYVRPGRGLGLNPLEVLHDLAPQGNFLVEHIHVDRLSEEYSFSARLKKGASRQNLSFFLSPSSVNEYLQVLNHEAPSVPPTIQTLEAKNRWQESMRNAAAYYLRFIRPETSRRMRLKIKQALQNANSPFARESLELLF